MGCLVEWDWNWSLVVIWFVVNEIFYLEFCMVFLKIFIDDMWGMDFICFVSVVLFGGSCEKFVEIIVYLVVWGFVNGGFGLKEMVIF